MPPVTEAVAAFTARYGPLTRDTHVLVAVSGGVDSCVLLDLLLRWREQHPLALTVAHFNHGIRGAAADADAAYVRAEAHRAGLACVVGSAPDPAPPADEAALRAARYGWLTHAAVQCGATHVAVGHTRTDQVETVVLRLLRGTGLHGLGGMRAVRPLIDAPRVQLIRPLLDLTHTEIRAYAREHQIAHREDASNADVRYARNRVRHRVLPGLRELAPDLEHRVAQLADRLAADETYLADAAATLEPALVAARGPGWCAYDRAALAAAPGPMQSRVLRRAFCALAAWPYAPDAAAVDTVLAALPLHAGDGAADWPKGVRIRWVGNRLTLARVPVAADLAPQPLAVPGHVRWDPTGQRIHTRILESAPSLQPTGAAHLHADLTGTPRNLLVRGWRRGDVWRPAGHGGTEPVCETLRRLGVPVDRRPAAPVLAGEDGVWWVVGARAPAEAHVVRPGAPMLEVTVG